MLDIVIGLLYLNFYSIGLVLLFFFFTVLLGGIPLLSYYSQVGIVFIMHFVIVLYFVLYGASEQSI